MISLRKLPVLVGIVLVTASAAFAQTTGTINITGTIPDAVSMTDTSGVPLSTTVALGVLTPADTATMATGAATVRLRSNKAYTLSADAVLNFGAVVADNGGDPITLADIGFAITGMTLTGTNVATGGSHTVATGFNLPGAWPVSADGLTPVFGKTLSNITTSTQILSGSRISKKGNMMTNNNFIGVTLGVAVLPQYFTPNGFTATITLTMASQ